MSFNLNLLGSDKTCLPEEGCANHHCTPAPFGLLEICVLSEYTIRGTLRVALFKKPRTEHYIFKHHLILGNVTSALSPLLCSKTLTSTMANHNRILKLHALVQSLIGLSASSGAVLQASDRPKVVLPQPNRLRLIWLVSIALKAAKCDIRACLFHPSRVEESTSAGALVSVQKG